MLYTCEWCNKEFKKPSWRIPRFCSQECLWKGKKKEFKLNAEKRFWNKVKKTSVCWEWQGNTNDSGYGTFSYDGKTWRAHRFAVFLATGKHVSKDLIVCHKCDNRKCVNPSHLFVGTQLDNMRDMISKGRDIHPCNFIQPNRRKLDQGQRELVKELSRKGMNDRQISEYFSEQGINITAGSIYGIRIDRVKRVKKNNTLYSSQ